MPRLESPVTPIPTECSNPIPGRHRESPDLVTRCMTENLVEVGTIGVESRNDADSPTNHTEIIISDDDTPSFHSDATIVLDPDIIIDYERKPAHEDSDPLSTASCSTPKIAEGPVQGNVGWIRCKPMKDLLSDEIVLSSETQVNGIDNGIDLEKVDLIENRLMFENGTDSSKRFDPESSESSSSSPIPPSPVPQRLRPRRRKLVSSDSDSDTTRVDALKRPQKNMKTEIKGKRGNYQLFMKEWSMHETTPPTSESDESDDDFGTRQNQHSIHRLPTPTKLSVKKKFTPKYILDKNLKVIGTINTQTDKPTGKVYNTRSTKVNVGNKIQQTSNSKTLFSHPSHDGNVMCVHNKVVACKSNNIIDDDNKCVMALNLIRKNDRPNVSGVKNVNEELIPRKLDKVKLSSNMRKVNPYTQWMQRHPRIEEQISRKRDIPTGSSFCQWERVGMLWWLLKTKKIPVARLKRTWAEMQEDGYLKHRSMRSLQNHFLRKILPNLQEFALPVEVVEEFREIMH